MSSAPLCEHYACRCARAAELAELAEVTGRGQYLIDAIDVHRQQVRCRITLPIQPQPRRRP